MINMQKELNGNDLKDKTKGKLTEAIEFEGFGDDDHKTENQEMTVVLPLQGGLAGLIQNLSGVSYSHRIYIQI